MYFSNIFHFPPNQNKNMNIIIVYFSVANRRSFQILAHWPGRPNSKLSFVFCFCCCFQSFKIVNNFSFVKKRNQFTYSFLFFKSYYYINFVKSLLPGKVLDLIGFQSFHEERSKYRKFDLSGD